MADEADEKDEQGKTAADYDDVRFHFSKAFRSESLKKLGDVVDTTLTYLGDPKNYRSYCYYARTVTESLVLWLIGNGWLELTEKSTATDDEYAKAVEKDKQVNELSEVFNQPAADEPAVRGLNGYL